MSVHGADVRWLDMVDSVLLNRGRTELRNGLLTSATLQTDISIYSSDVLKRAVEFGL